MKYKLLFENWKNYLLLESSVNISKKEAIDKLKSIPVYSNDITLNGVINFINSSSNNDWSNFKKYFNTIFSN